MEPIESNSTSESMITDLSDVIQEVKEVKEDITNNIDSEKFGSFIEKFFNGTPYDPINILKWFKEPENALTAEEYSKIVKYLERSGLSNREKIEFILRLRDNLYKLNINNTEDRNLRFTTILYITIENKSYSEILLESSNNLDEKSITSILFKYIDQGINIFGDISLTDEVGNPIVIFDENLEKIISDKNYIIRLDDLPGALKGSILRIIREKLNEKIKELTSEYFKDVNDEVDESLIKEMLENKEFNYILDQYDTIQRIFRTTTSIQGNRNLKERFKAILSRFGYKVINVDKKLLRQQQEEEKRIREANKKRVEARKKTNQEINGKSLSQNNKYDKSIDITNNINKAEENNEGVQILKDSNIDASEFEDDKKNIALTENDELYLKNEAFNIARDELLSNQGIINKALMHRLYNIKTMEINDSEREETKSKLRHGGISEKDIKEADLLLKQFDNKIKSLLEELYVQYYEDKERIYDSTKLTAAGDIINSIAYIFSSLGEKLKYGPLCEGFKYASENPIKIDKEKGDMLINGTLNGTEINIKYNMKDGGLFMNSFIKENHNPNMFIIGDKDADYQLPKIDSFAEILNKHGNLDNLYEENNQLNPGFFEGGFQGPRLIPTKPGNKNIKSNLELQQREDSNRPEVPRKNPVNHGPIPPIKPGDNTHPGRIPLPGLIGNNGELSENNKIQFEEILGNTLDVIGEKVKNHINEYSTLNTVIDKLFTTIVPNYGDEIFVHEGSNIFEALQILKNADETDLQYFNNEFMPKIMKLSGMEWGKYTQFPNSNRIQVNFKDVTESPRANFIDKITDFKKESDKLGTWLNYNSSYNHCIAEVIKDVIKNDNKITKQNMEKYVDELENDKYIGIDEELDKKLSEV